MRKTQELKFKIEGLQKDVSSIKNQITSRDIALAENMRPIGRVIRLPGGQWFRALGLAQKGGISWGCGFPDWENYDGVIISMCGAKIGVGEIAQSTPADPDSLGAKLFAAYDKHMKAGENKRKTE